MAVNVVEILVKAKDMTKEGFAAADANATAMKDAVTKAGLVAAAGLAAVAVGATDMAMKYQSATTLLQTQAGVTGAKFAQMKAGVLQLAGVVGFSPDSLAEAAYHVASNMASMGATAPQMLNAVKVAAEGARVGGADLVDVTNALGAVIASGLPGVQNYTRAMGVLNATVGAGDMKMQDLAEAFGTGMLATVKGFGITLKDVGAALATFGDNNIRGAKAGTDLRMAVQALAAPIKAGIPILNQLGLSATKLATDMQHGGLNQAITDLRNHMIAAGVSAKQQGQVITEIFGKKAGTGINILIGQYQRLESKYPEMARGAHNFGKAWQDTQKNLSTQLHQLSGSFDALMISIGDRLIPVVSKLVGWMLQHKQATLAIIGAVAAFAGVLATLAVAIKTVEIAVKAWEIAQALLDVVLTANPIGVLIMAIAGLVALLVLAWNHSKVFRDVVKTAMRDVAAAFVLMWHAAVVAFHAVMSVIGVVINWIKAHWPLLLGILTGPIGLAVVWIVQHWHQLVAGTESMVRSVVTWFRNLPRMILSAVGNLGTLLWQGGVNLVMGLVHGIEAVASAPFHAVASIVQGIRNLLPFSPAKVGPLSGGGSPDIAGRKIATMLAAGMTSGTGAVGAAAARMAGAAGVRPGAAAAAAGPGGGQAGGTLQLEFTGSNADILNGLMKLVRVSGGDPRIFTQRVRLA